MGKILIKNGTLVNPDGKSGRFDVLINNTIVERIAPQIECEEAFLIDAEGKWVMPGLVDMHCHLREPGFEYKEDIRSGTAAAVNGGYTAIACMANTEPVIDNSALLDFINAQANAADNARVYPIAAMTKGLKGEELSEMGLLQQAGAVAFSDDGKPVADANRMRLAMEYARAFDALIISHCEELSLVGEGVMNEGYWSAVLGLKGISRVAEEAMVARDLLLAENHGARLHIAHVSTAGSVELIRLAKARGVNVTAETAPHYFSATDAWVQDYDTNTKMNPPLRTDADVAAIKAGLADGTIDAIATDHAPHHIDEKRVEYASAYNGIVGLETAFSLAVTHLVHTGVLTPKALVSTLSAAPARILRVPGGVVAEGAQADITIADPDADIVYTAEMLKAKSKNTPFLHRSYRGVILHTIVGGTIKK